jgi:hypothetical protein
MTGVIPKRSDQRIRRNIPEVPIDKITAIGVVPIPELDLTSLGETRVHRLVVDMYESLKESAQNTFYEPSDWQTARLTMLALNQELFATYQDGNPRPMTAMKLDVINRMLASLMTTEGERRRARLEIERNQSGPVGTVTQIADVYRERLGAVR